MDNMAISALSSPAFVSPAPLSLIQQPLVLASSTRRPGPLSFRRVARQQPHTSRLRPFFATAAPPPPHSDSDSDSDSEDDNDNDNEPSNSNTTSSSPKTALHTEVSSTVSEMDSFAQHWIGTDISRWEWYERLKSRRSKLIDTIAEDEVRFDEDMETLRRTFMELDATLGTSFLDCQSNISSAGWALITTFMAFYVAIGYAIVHTIVQWVMLMAPSATFP